MSKTKCIITKTLEEQLRALDALERHGYTWPGCREIKTGLPNHETTKGYEVLYLTNWKDDDDAYDYVTISSLDYLQKHLNQYDIVTFEEMFMPSKLLL